jgi:hypothetical protein
VSKGRCASRAEWRFELGKPAKQLSPHYRLDCDFGTAIMVCWAEGGSEPVYLCESHAEEQKRRSEKRAEARRPTAKAADDSGCGSVRAKTTEAAETPSTKRTEETPSSAKGEEIPAVDTTPAAPLVANQTAVLHGPTAPGATALNVPVAESSAAITEPSPASAGREADATPPSTVPDVSAAKPQEATEVKEAVDAGPPKPAPAEKPIVVPVPAPAAAKPIRATKDSSARPPARDIAFGNPAKAIVDEAIWNLPAGDDEAFRTALQQGKSAVEAAQAAGGQLAAIHRRVTEYSLKLDAVLAASAKTISVQETIDTPLEQAMLDIIENESMSESEKDAAVQQLGALQEWAKYGLKAQVTALEANRGLFAIGDRMNWGGTNEIPDRLKPAYRALFASLKKAIHASVPDAQELHDRLVNLRAAKSDLLAAPAPELIPR